jgi:hypothetical protein
MPGIRLTLAREKLQVFVRYPPPWRAVYNIVGILRIEDARGKVIVETRRVHTVCHLMWDMYEYIAPSRAVFRELPNSLAAYPFPWRYLEVTSGTGPWGMLTTADGRLIPCATQPQMAACLKDLERLVAAKHSSQQRGL